MKKQKPKFKKNYSYKKNIKDLLFEVYKLILGEVQNINKIDGSDSDLEKINNRGNDNA